MATIVNVNMATFFMKTLGDVIVSCLYQTYGGGGGGYYLTCLLPASNALQPLVLC